MSCKITIFSPIGILDVHYTLAISKYWVKVKCSPKFLSAKWPGPRGVWQAFEHFTTKSKKTKKKNRHFHGHTNIVSIACKHLSDSNTDFVERSCHSSRLALDSKLLGSTLYSLSIGMRKNAMFSVYSTTTPLRAWCRPRNYIGMAVLLYYVMYPTRSAGVFQ